MSNEHIGICIYEKGRFELRETDNAIIDLKGDFPPIMIVSNTVDDGSEPNCADMRSVLHLLNELSDNNPNEERHWYLKKMLDKAWKQYHEQKEENEQLKKILGFLKNDNAEDILNVLNSQENRLWELKQENEKLKAQLYCPFDSICTQCNNEYLVQKEYYYVSKCKKGHEQCSKVDVKYCDDFELKGDDVND